MSKMSNHDHPITRNGELRDLLDESLGPMQDLLIATLDRKLTNLDLSRLRLYLRSERENAAKAEWERQKDRLKT